MDDTKLPLTTTSSPASQTSRVTRWGTPLISRGELAAILADMSLIYHRAPLSAIQAKALGRIYFEDLNEFTAHAVLEACRQYRREADAEHFPKPGRLIELARKVKDPNYDPAADPWQRKREGGQ